MLGPRVALGCPEAWFRAYSRADLTRPAAIALAQPLIGTTLIGDSGSRYTVQEEIGEGGTARVYRVTAGDGSAWAAKLLSDHRFEVDAPMRERFLREIEELKEVDHPRVLRFHDRATFGAEAALIVELARCSLKQRLYHRSTPVPLPVSLGWLEQALLGTAVLHRQGFTHRDLSPKNLLLRNDGSLVVGDFGTVRHVDDATITQQREHFGSLLYVSAQQFDAPHDAEAHDDVFALGQIAWELLAGRPPIGNAPSIAAVSSDLPEGLGDLVERMRSDDSARRPPDAGVALNELRKVLVANRDPRLLDRGSPEYAATVRAVERRQRSHLAGPTLTGALAGPARALTELIDALGPIRLEPGRLESAGTARVEAPVEMSAGLHLALADGSLSFVCEAFDPERDDGWLLQLRNSITGRQAAVAHEGVFITAGADLLDALRVLEGLRTIDLKDREAFLAPFSAPAFLLGTDCAECGTPLHLQRRSEKGIFAGQGLFRASTCAGDNPPEPFRCCVCGERFRRTPDSDEQGYYESAGCACGNSLGVLFEDRPWRHGCPLSISDVRRIFG